MTARSIDNVPDEVLLHIFAILDGKTLKECAIVSKR